MIYPEEFQRCIVKYNGTTCKAVFIRTETGLPLFLAVSNCQVRELKGVTEWKPDESIN